jgi:rare lipoprotein A
VNRSRTRLLPLAVALASLTGCFTPRPVTPPAPAAPAIVPAPTAPTAQSGAQFVPDAIPRVEPRSRYGNPPFYEVFGKRYYVLSSSVAYVERGVASWYGPGFHQVLTSTRERYDMYAMTAAHKTLPLPAYVRVTNLQNGRSVVVRVNDRGPS